MDTDDVSQIRPYIDLLEKSKATLKAAEGRDGEIPSDRKSKSEQIRAQELQAFLRSIHFNTNGSGQIQTSFFPRPYLPCTTSLKDLTPIYIKELRLGIHHRNRYLVVRSISVANRMVGIMAAVEDEMGDATLLQLYQQSPENDTPTADTVAVGDVFVVMEPYFKIMSDGGYGIRVDHINDIQKVNTEHRLFPIEWQPRIVDLDATADDWKQAGNVAIGLNKYQEALDNYTRGLASNPTFSEQVVIRSNRALANLKYGRFEDALTDTQCALPSHTFPISEKAFYRGGKALYELGRYSESVDIFKNLQDRFPKNTDGVKELARAELRVFEQQTGQYDFKAIYAALSKLRPPFLDHATFVGPIVVRATKDRGEGVFTTSAVKAGDLLLCEKAFAHCHAPTSKKQGGNMAKVSLLINIHTNVMTLGTQSDLITAIVQKLASNPSYLSDFIALHHGSYKTAKVSEVDGKPVIDTFLIERVVALNAFGCPLTSKDQEFDSDTNSDAKSHSCGVWTLASKINHACNSNVRRGFIGDLQIIRATCDIPPNTELRFWYKTPTGDYLSMQKSLEPWDFKCDCSICLDLLNTAKKQLKKRQDLLGDLKVAFQPITIDTAKVERLLKAIGQTYKHPPSKVPRLALQEYYIRLLNTYHQQQNAGKVNQTCLKALEILGFVIKEDNALGTFHVENWGIMVDDVIGLFQALWKAYVVMNPKMLEAVEKYEKLAYKICMGEDVTYCAKHHMNG